LSSATPRKASARGTVSQAFSSIHRTHHVEPQVDAKISAGCSVEAHGLHSANMRFLIETIGGLYELFRLGVITRFRFRGPYWTWRMETAFGIDPAQYPPFSARLHAALDYGRWVYRMKRGR
jgi:hypothetical protein